MVEEAGHGGAQMTAEIAAVIYDALKTNGGIDGKTGGIGLEWNATVTGYPKMDDDYYGTFIEGEFDLFKVSRALIGHLFEGTK